MRDGRKIITKEMLEAAKAHNMCISQTAKYYGFHHKSITSACERFGVTLPFSIHSPQKFGTKKMKPTPPAPKKKPAPVWSASPAAIQRALAKAGRID